MLLNETKPHLGISALKLAAQSCNLRPNSAGDAIRGKPVVEPFEPVINREIPQCTTVRQLGSIEGEVPNSVATCMMG